MASTKSRKSKGQGEKKGLLPRNTSCQLLRGTMPKIDSDRLTFFFNLFISFYFSSHTVYVILQGNPYLISSSNDCSYWFVWRTPAACSTDRPSGGNGGGIFGTM